MNTETNCKELNLDEMSVISGGDEFTHDLGAAIGKLLAQICNGLDQALEDMQNTPVEDLPPC